MSPWSPFFLIAAKRRLHESTQRFLDGRRIIEQPVFRVPWAYDLHTDGQSGGREAGLHGDSRRMERGCYRYPVQERRIGLRPAIDIEDAVVERRLLQMLDRRRRRDRHDDGIIAREE